MIKINYPSPNFRIKNEQDKEWIFDAYRKQWVVLTAEEWVRQNLLTHLVSVKKYPASLIAIEKEILLGELKKRFDILIYKDAKPWMIIECKEPNTPLTELVLHQVLNYHIALPTPFLLISNGNHTLGFKVKDSSLVSIEELPDYI